MTYFVYNRANGRFVLATESTRVLACFSSKDYEVISSVKGY